MVTAPPRTVRATATALAAGLALLALLFRDEIAAALRVWTNSTAYNHCFLVLPIAAYLAWDRRATLVGIAIRPAPWVGLAALPLGAAWLAAERLGIMEGRQLVLIGFVELLCLAVLGWRMFGRLAAPLLYLFFLVPFGEFIVPTLQAITTRFIEFGLGLTSLPYFIDNYVIEIPEGTFYVAEACAGLRFLIASVAFGVLYAVLIYRGWLRRTVFIAVSIVVPVVANGLRALGIVWLGHMLGSAQAAAADHVLYGWIFFSIVILLLVALGLPFRQDTAAPASRPAPAPPLPAALGASLAAAALLVACAASGPVAAGMLDRRVSVAASPAVDLQMTGCTAVAGPRNGVRQYSCEDGAIRLLVAVFSPRTGPGPVLAEQRRMLGLVAGADIEVARLDLPGSPVPWRLAESHEPPPSAALTALWIDGQPSAGGLAMRVRQAITSLGGGRFAPVVVVAELDFSTAPPGRSRDWPEERLRAFLSGHPELPAALARLAAGAVSPP